jgi:hypothetical protein
MPGNGLCLDAPRCALELDRKGIQRNSIVRDAGQRQTDLNLASQLFQKLPSEGMGIVFSGLDLSSWKFPEARMRATRAPLGEKEQALSLSHTTDDPKKGH